jgi:hypothetical protein
MRWIANGTDTTGSYATITATETATNRVSFYLPVGVVDTEYLFVSQRMINMGTSNYVVNAQTQRASSESRAAGVDQYSFTNDATSAGNNLIKFIIPPGETTATGLGRHILTYWFEPLTYVPAVQVRYSTSLVRKATENEILYYNAGGRDFR